MTLTSFPHLLAAGFDNPYLIEQSLESLAGPLGLILGTVGVFLMIGVVVSKRLYMLTISFLLASSAIVSHNGGDLSFLYTDFLEKLAGQSRNLVLATLTILLLPSLMIARGIRHRLIHEGLFAYFAFQILYTFEVAASRTEGGILRLVTGVILFVLLLAVLGFGLSKMLQDNADVTLVMKAIAWAGVIFIGLTIFELMRNRHTIVVNGRLVGLCASATFCAELLVAVMLPTLYLLTNGELSRAARLFWTVVISLEGVMMIGTGTRTGLVMLGIGLVLQLRARITKIFPLALAFAIAITLIMAIVPEDLGITGADRIFSLMDTRSGSWEYGMSYFYDSPFFGSSVQGKFLLTENSYISALGTTGLVGILPLAVSLILLAYSMLQLLLRRPHVNASDRLLIDMVVAGLCAELAGAFFDAFLIATVSIQIYIFAIYTTLLLYTLERTAPDRQERYSNRSASMQPLGYDPAYAL